mmetsp:Transcript_9102/g.10932  ORF Transcript_9102/g.10932 Transcript_9102/m.10932 type:complete len:161 (-) Transcript_9102:73-555(-)
MGAGASAVKEPNVPLGSTMASREAQGQDLGMEYEVTLLKPKLKDVNLNEKYILRVGYEALVLLKNDETKSPVTYFKYQDIISWGSTNKFFTFKVFGNAMQHHLPVSIIVTPSFRHVLFFYRLSLYPPLSLSLFVVSKTKKAHPKKKHKIQFFHTLSLFFV